MLGEQGGKAKSRKLLKRLGKHLFCLLCACRCVIARAHTDEHAQLCAQHGIPARACGSEHDACTRACYSHTRKVPVPGTSALAALAPQVALL